MLGKNEVERQEQASRDEILTGLKEHAIELKHLVAEILLLEKMLDLKKRKLHKLQGSILGKQAGISLSQEEKRELYNLATSYDAARTADYGRRLEALAQLQEVKAEDVTCFFDYPQNLQVTIFYNDRPSVTVDLVDSVRKDPNNIGHPLVVMALRRYAKHISPLPKSASRRKAAPSISERMKPEVAKNNIDRIFRALMISVGTSQPIPLEDTYLSVMTLVRKFPQDYFETLWRFLHESSVKNAKRGGTKVELVKRQLMDKYPEFDHELTIDYLQNVFLDGAKVKLPKRGGGDALRNALVGWKYDIEPKSAKEYLSKAQRWLGALASNNKASSKSESPDGSSDKKPLFSEEEIDELTKENMFRLFGVTDIQPYEDISTLVKVSRPLLPATESSDR
jgi:hypothetical protein